MQEASVKTWRSRMCTREKGSRLVVERERTIRYCLQAIKSHPSSFVPSQFSTRQFAQTRARRGSILAVETLTGRYDGGRPR